MNRILLVSFMVLGSLVITIAVAVAGGKSAPPPEDAAASIQDLDQRSAMRQFWLRALVYQAEQDTDGLSAMLLNVPKSNVRGIEYRLPKSYGDRDIGELLVGGHPIGFNRSMGIDQGLNALVAALTQREGSELLLAQLDSVIGGVLDDASSAGGDSESVLYFVSARARVTAHLHALGGISEDEAASRMSWIVDQTQRATRGDTIAATTW